MLYPGRNFLLNIAEAGLPGLVHFASDPLSIYPDRPFTRLKLYLPDQAILNLKRLTFHGVDTRKLTKNAKVRMSSKHSSSRPPEELLTGGWIHTERETGPFWEVEFKQPVDAIRLDILNRPGVWSSRAFGLCVEFGNAGGQTSMYDHLAAERLLAALSNIERDLHHLIDALLSFEGKAGAIKSLCNSAKALLVATRRALTDPAVKLGELSELRQRCALDVVGIFEEAKGTELATLLASGKRFIDALLWKAKPTLSLEIDATDARLVALCFAAEVMAEGMVSLHKITDHERFLASSSMVLGIEKETNALALRANFQGMDLPVMFRAHGMKGSPLQADAQSFIDAMKALEIALQEIGYESCICYGTLLGAVRERAFIPHDDDVDMAVVLKGNAPVNDELAQVLAGLREKGVEGDFCSGFSFLKIVAGKRKRMVDLFPIIPVDDSSVEMYMEQLKLRKVPRSSVLPLDAVDFLGTRFASPANPADFLQDRYGESWRIPQRIVGHKMLAVDPPAE